MRFARVNSFGINSVRLVAAVALATLEGTASFAATGVVVPGLTVPMQGVATLSSAPQIRYLGVLEALAGVGQLSITPAFGYGGKATLIGEAALTGSAQFGYGGKATLSGNAEFNGVPYLRIQGYSQVSGEAEFAASGRIWRAAYAHLQPESEFTALPLIAKAAQADLTGQGHFEFTDFELVFASVTEANWFFCEHQSIEFSRSSVPTFYSLPPPSYQSVHTTPALARPMTPTFERTQ